MSLNRFWNGQGKQPVWVDDQVKLFNDGSEKFCQNETIEDWKVVKIQETSISRMLFYNLIRLTWQKSGVSLRIRACFDQSLSSPDKNVLEFWQKFSLKRLNRVR